MDTKSDTAKHWHQNFIDYMWFIIKHPNYEGLPIQIDNNGSPKWIATAKSEIGINRKAWADEKATKLNIEIQPGVYAKVMYAIHPTKLKVCQICGESMSISYVYPNANFAKLLVSEFDIDIDVYDTFSDLWDRLITEDRSNKARLIKLINQKFGTSFKGHETQSSIIDECESLCRLGGKAHLGPGAMSNFPDRYDGFHTYNRCHRSTEDKGRSKENMKTYTRDRRAYEYWSDGNILAANMFMGSKVFHGISADHVGPISLGFIHDSHYLKPMSRSDNSSKRDRLTVETVYEVLQIQTETGVYPVSWYSSKIWDFIALNFEKNPDKVPSEYRSILKKNMSNYMHILKTISDSTENGINFLVESFINTKKDDFRYKYSFDINGNILSKEPRNVTQSAKGEFGRFERIALAGLNDYAEKSNRNVTQNLTKDELSYLESTVNLIANSDYTAALIRLKLLMDKVQLRLISEVQ